MSVPRAREQRRLPAPPDRLPSPRGGLLHSARARAAAALLALVGALALPATAEAQTTTTFVSNAGETWSGSASSIMAQSFTTGSNTGGYTLSEVGARVFYSGTTSGTVVKVKRDNGSGRPGDLVANLENPSIFTNDAFNSTITGFTAPAGTETLAADTVYWVVVNEGRPSSNRMNLGRTSSSDETATPADPNWSIGDTRYWKNNDGSSWAASTRLLVLAIKGTAGGGTPSNPTMSVGDAEGNESDGVTFTVTLSEAVTTEVTATWTASTIEDDEGKAAAADLESTTGTVTIEMGETTGTFTVPTADDSTDEHDETFTVTLSDPSANAELATDATATGTILDDDALPVLNVENASATEGAPVVFTVTLSPASGKTATLQWRAEVSGGDGLLDATLGLDFASIGGTLTFDPGQTERTIEVATLDDTLDEADEIFVIRRGAAENAKYSSIVDSGVGTIVDNDALSALSIAPAAGTEGGLVTFTVTLSPASGREVAVDWGTSVETDDTAVSGTDFTAGSGTLAIQAGETTGTVSVEAASDSASENDETFTLTLSSAEHATLPSDAKVKGTIRNNAIPRPEAPGTFMATAGNAVVELSWDTPAGDAAITRHEFRYKTAGDYPATWTEIADSAPGGTNQAGFTVTGLMLGTAHTFQIRAVGAGGNGAVATSAVVTPQQTMPLTCTPGPEDLWCGVLTVGRTSNPDADDAQSGYCGPDCDGVISEQYGQLGDTSFELDGTTYAIQSIRWDTHPTNSGSLYFDLDGLPAESVYSTWYLRVGANSFGGLFSVDGNQLSHASAYYGLTPPALNTTVTVRLTTSSEGALSDNNDLMGLTVNDGSMDVLSPTFDVEQYIYTALVPYVVETVTVKATPQDDGATVIFWDADGLALVDADGTQDGFQVPLDVGGNVILIHVTAENGIGSIDSYTVTVTREEALPELSVANMAGLESDGVTFTVTLSEAAAAEVTATWTASIETDDTAAAEDLGSTTTGPVSIAMGATTGTFTVPTAGDTDTTDEDDETFTVTLSSPSANAMLASDPTATGTITDDDDPPTISVEDQTVIEGDQDPDDIVDSGFPFRVTLSAASEKQVRYRVRRVELASDTATDADVGVGTVFGGRESISPGDTDDFVEADNIRYDDLDEPDETFTLEIYDFENATAGIQTRSTITIEDDDDPPSVSVGDAPAAEGAPMEFPVTLSAASGWEVTVGWATSVETGDNATSDTDFTAASGTLSITAGQTTATIAVQTTEDTVDEDDETFTVTLSNATNATLATDPTAAESDGVTFTVTLSEAATDDVTATWTASIESGDSAEAEDLGSTTGTVTVMESQTTAMITVPTAGDPEDTTDEDDETFTLTLSSPSANATLAADPTATGTLNDDDDPPSVSVGDEEAAEGAPVEFAVTLSAVSGKTVTVNWATSVESGDSATADTDFTAASGTLTFMPDETTAMITVQTTDDTLVEPDETFTVTLSSPTNAMISDATAKGTITNDDVPPDPPTDFTAKAGNMEVALAWKAPALDSGVTGHEFRYKTDGDYPEEWTAIANSAPDEANEGSFTVTMLTNEVAHTFELHAVNAAGAGDAAEAGPVTPTPGICDRTQKIQDAILGEISGVDDCAAVTDANLASITSLGNLGFGTFNQGITSLQKGDFAGLTSLTILRLSNNGLTALPEGIFAGLAELDELILGTNQLESLPEGVFDGLVKLEGIILSANSLTGVPAGAFDGLPVLVEIDLGGNDLSSLPEDLFSGLPALTTLFLGSNDLESLPDGVFSGLTALEKLQLNGNDLTMLPVTMFSGLPALEALRLDGNELSSLPVTVFSSLTNLTVLWLNGNDLDSLPGTVFSGLTALDKLYLQDNNLTTLPDGLFTGVTLGTLHLGDNPDADDVLPLTVTVEKVGTNQVRAKVFAGAPFAVDIPVTLVNGTLAGSVTELSVAAGAVYSEPVTMTRTAGTTAAATVDVDLTTPPTLPADNSGYIFKKATVNLPATILPDATNAAPAFTSSATFNPAENQTAVGTVEAEDSDTTDEITGYALSGGADQALFSINDSGVLTFQVSPNYEAPQDANTDNAYLVTVQATSGTGDREQTAPQTITVTVMDADEQPDQPDKPTLAAVSGSSTSLVASWTKPGRNGGPDITGYNVQYRVSTATTWNNFTHTGTTTTTTLTGLTASTSYQVRVQALNGETPSAWSDPSEAVSTEAAAANNPPVFSGSMTTRTVPENSAAGTDVGTAVTAMDDDRGDTLTYSLDGTNAASFDIDEDSGQIRTRSGVTYNHEEKSSYAVIVAVTDDTDRATIGVLIDIADVDEQPDQPAKPTLAVVSGSSTSLVASWTKPGRNGGPDITGYNVEYRVSTSGDWENFTRRGLGVTRTLTGLTASTSYQVQVQALNGETPSAWSDPSDAVSTEAVSDAPTPEEDADRLLQVTCAIARKNGVTDSDGLQCEEYLDGDGARTLEQLIALQTQIIDRLPPGQYDYYDLAGRQTLYKAEDGRSTTTKGGSSGPDSSEPDAPPPVSPLTAHFADVPSGHDGARAFTLRVAFSEAIAIGYEVFRDHSVGVIGGEVTRARRVDKRRDLWEITVKPASDAAVSVSLSPPPACDETGAICTGDGRPLSASITAIVPGPAQEAEEPEEEQPEEDRRKTKNSRRKTSRRKNSRRKNSRKKTNPKSRRHRRT